MEVEPFGCGHRRQLLVCRHRSLPGHPVLPGQSVDVVTFTSARGARVELVRSPHDIDLVGVLETFQRGLEAALADRTPRAHHVGKDLYQHVRGNPPDHRFIPARPSSTPPDGSTRTLTIAPSLRAAGGQGELLITFLGDLDGEGT